MLEVNVADRSIVPRQEGDEVRREKNVTGQVWQPSARPNDAAKVLVVVEDDTAIRTLIVKALGTAYTVYEARCGEEARLLLEGLPSVDGLVCDIMMPRIDGLTLAQIARRTPKLSHVPILFLTAKGSTSDVVAGINAGARHYLTKPFKLPELLAKVRAMTK
ncbi:MAG: response regulator transcription factor [Polyangiaceae bacterium]